MYHDCSLLRASAFTPSVKSGIQVSSLLTGTDVDGGADTTRGTLSPGVSPWPFDGERSTPSTPLLVEIGPALLPLSRCTPAPGSRAFPAPLVHTPVGTGIVRAPPRGGKSAGCNNTAGAFVEWLR
jgi:hypothetical protein